ncbi:MAG: hypothetical protein ACK5HR_03445, partial [Mycoplasmatales bacterium]
DNTINEIAIPEIMAVDYASKLNLNSLNELINQTIIIPTTNFDNEDIVQDKEYKVVGIYEQNTLIRTPTIFGYNSNGTMYQNALPSALSQEEEQVEDAYDSYLSTLEEINYPPISKEEYLKLAGDDIESIYIKCDPTQEEEVYTSLKNMFPNKLIISNYEYNHGDVAKANNKYYNQLKLGIIISALISFAILLIFAKQYYMMKIEQEKLLILFGMPKNSYNKLNSFENLIQLLCIIIIYIIADILVLNQGKLVCLTTICIFIIINIIINLIINKIFKRKTNAKN